MALGLRASTPSAPWRPPTAGFQPRGIRKQGASCSSFVLGAWAVVGRFALGSAACRGFKVFVHMVGKSSAGGWEDAAAENYAKRLRGRTPAVEVETVCHKSDGQLMRALGKVQHPLLVLDERGAFVNSEEFTDLLFDSLQAGGARLGFVIGGADGLPDELRQVQKAQLKKEGRMRQLLSLGRLTLPHRLARVVLVEQIYRAQEIRRGSSYHRGEPK
ncbi:unnamed protein product [Effrenium voratum]|uniref:Ribosomal RNA large subunit methyltransferase H n=1 Tax=Effrenium voratum TaxID=2562239 RepID=A0AA36J8I6_9DINO|nr:unnamed protein product [Effrenium voratum]